MKNKPLVILVILLIVIFSLTVGACVSDTYIDKNQNTSVYTDTVDNFYILPKSS